MGDSMNKVYFRCDSFTGLNKAKVLLSVIALSAIVLCIGARSAEAKAAKLKPDFLKKST